MSVQGINGIKSFATAAVSALGQTANANPAQFNGLLQNAQNTRGPDRGFAYRSGLSKEIQDRGIGFITQMQNGEFESVGLS